VLRVSMLVMYLCVRGHVFVCWMSCISVLWISNVASFYDFDISLCNCYDSVVFYSEKKSIYLPEFNLLRDETSLVC
jgi:hypothetical protein